MSEPAAPAVAPFDVGEVPFASAVRRYTTRAGRARATASVGSLLSDVYYAVVSTAIALGLAFGVAGTLRVALPPAPSVPESGLSLATLVVVLLVGLAGVLLSLAGRLGPVGAGGAEAAWWLGLPVERRGLLRPAARRLPVVAALAAAVVVALLDAGLLTDAPARVVVVTVTGALAAAALVLGAAVGQSWGVARRTTALVGDLVLALAPLLAVGLAVRGWHVDAVPALPWPAVGGLVLLVGLLGWLVDSRLGRIPARSLQESGSVAAQAVGAAVSLDSRELGRALTDAAAPPARRFVSRLRTARGAASALVTTDLVALRRSPRHVVQLVATALVPVLVASVPELASPVGVLVAVLLAGYVAASATGEGARRAEMAPVLDRLLPLDARTTRRLRTVVPTAAMLLWSLVVLVAVGRWAGDPSGWVPLAVAGAPVWACAAVRAAYRPAPDWGGPLVSTPAGAVPTGVAAVLARGPDVVLVGLLPWWVSILLERTSQTLLVVQLVLAGLAFVFATSVRTKPLLEQLQEQADAAGARR